MAGKKISAEVTRQLTEIGLETLAPKLEALGVRTTQDLALVDDADLVRWGLSTIERRRFFAHVRAALGETGGGADLGFLPPSALTQVAIAKKTGANRRRADPASQSMGPARLDELLGRGSAEYQLPRLAERMLAATGPLDIPELGNRLARAAPALAQGYEAHEWPQFVEAAMRGYNRLQVEDGVLAGDKPIVSIRSTVLFSASEEVISDMSCWLRVAYCLSTPGQVAILATLCRGSREVADGPAVWSKLLARWYPKATLLNPDWLAQAELEKRLEAALDNDYTLAALTRRLENDTPLDIGDLLRALPQQTTPKVLVKFMSSHPENFRQSPDGKKFAVAKSPQEWKNLKEWRTVNPFQAPPVPKDAPDAGSSSAGPPKEGRPSAPVPMGRPTELRQVEVQARASDGPKPAAADSAPPPPQPQICQQLDPKQAFRLYHTGLLSQRSDQSKRGKLEAWEYFTESNSKCTMAPGDLLNLAESRVNSIRSNDPAVVHELVAQTLEGIVYKVPFGYWNRRVRILTNALNASQLRIGREQRKKYERKLLEFMEWVKKERGFGYYQCEACGGRWKSGFSYEEIAQACLQCGTFTKPYRIQDLESAAEREAREKGEPLPPKAEGEGGGKGWRKGPKGGKKGDKGGDKGGGSKGWAPRAGVDTYNAPQIYFEPPSLEHTRDGGKGGGQRRAWPGSAEATAWERNQRSRTDEPAEPPRMVPPRPKTGAQPVAPKAAAKATAPWPGAAAAAESSGAARPAEAAAAASSAAAPPAPAAAAPASTAAAPAGETPTTTYTPGSGGFFARRRAAAGGGTAVAAEAGGAGTAAATPPEAAAPAPAAPAAAPEAAAAPTVADAPAADAGAATYKPGGGGFFARRRAAGADASATSSSGGPTPAASQEAPPATAASTAGPLAPAAGPAEAAPTTASDAPTVETPAASYKPGGGGFFARRKAAAAGGEAASSGPAAAAAAEAPASTPSSSGVASAPAAAAPAADKKDEATAAEAKPEPKPEAKPAISADKLEAIKTLGLSLADAVTMGLIPASAVEGLEADKKPGDKRKADEKAPDDLSKQEQERRKAAAARFAARAAGGAAPSAEAAVPAGETAVASDESIIDAIGAAVVFLDPSTGTPRVLSPQASDVAFLISDAIFWPLLRRLAAEIAALEAGAKDMEGFWKGAPQGSEGAVKYAELRGYVLPQGLQAPAVNSFWRRALLAEVASDLLAARLEAGRGFDLPALAGPTEDVLKWTERPAESLEGIASAVDASASLGLAESLVKELGGAAGVTFEEGAALKDRLATVAEASIKAGLKQAAAPDAADAPVLKGGGWTLLQEMGVREAALALRVEYTVRRQILLRRLDVSVQAISCGEKAIAPNGQRKVADVLSRMWSGWRRGVSDAPPLSEWSALAATRGMLARAVTARVAGPGSRVSSSVKSVLIGKVPDRGGVPDGYRAQGSKQDAAASAAPAPAPAAKKPRTGSSITTVSAAAPSGEGDSARPSGSGAAGSSSEGAAAAASGGEGATAAASSGAAAGEATGEGEPASVGAKPPEKKGTSSGARSVNKELMEKAKAEQKKEREEGKKSSYYEELAQVRH